jgi:F-box/leucine-rich repeat protein 6
MNVNLLQDVKPHASTPMEVCASNDITVKNESENCTATTTATKIITTNTEISINDNDDSALLACLPKAEIKLKKLDETKMLMDNNENSLSVDTLIEILSSNAETKLLDGIKKEVELGENGADLISINAPPSSIPSTLNSPSSSSSSKTGFSSPNANDRLPPSFSSSTSTTSSSSGVFNSSPKKFPSPHYSNGGKPMMADLNKKMKQGAARRRAKPKAVYQSQISDNSVGIKLCIKKSIDTFKMMPSPNNNNNNNKSSSNKSPRKRSRKPKLSSSRNFETDSDDSYVKKRRKPASNNSTGKALYDEPQQQSVWGESIPKDVLFEVSRFVCTPIIIIIIIAFLSLYLL